MNTYYRNIYINKCRKSLNARTTAMFLFRVLFLIPDELFTESVVVGSWQREDRAEWLILLFLHLI